MVDIFVSHSSADKDLVAVVQDAFEEVGVNGYFAEFKTEGKPIPEKLRDAIRSSQVVVVLWTHNVSNVQKTRDVVNAEIGEAHMAGKPVYVFREDGTEVPLMLQHITDYFTFTKTTVADAVKRLKGFLVTYKTNEDFWKGVGVAALVVAIVGAVVGLIYLLASSGQRGSK